MVYKEIVEKVIELLKADSSLSEPEKVAKYYFGAPIGSTVYPYCYVQFVRKSATGISEITRFLYGLTFEIGFVDRNVDQDVAERSVYDKLERAEEVLDSNPTLDGLVEKEYEPREVAILRAREEDYAVAYGQLFATWRRWMP